MRTPLKTQQTLWAYGMLAPLLVLFVIFSVLPLALAFILAFKDFSILRMHSVHDLMRFLLGDYVGWRNFSDALSNPVFYAALRNTLVYTAVMVPFSVVTSLVLSGLIMPLNEKAQGFFRLAYYLPGIFSAVILSMVFRWILEPEKGLLNVVLGCLGVTGADWLGSPRYALGSIIATGAIYAPGFGVLLYTAAMARIPQEMHDAARIDGATLWQRWFRVVIPLLRPTTLYLMVMNMIWSFQVFTSVYIMTRGGPGDSTITLVYHIYDLAFAQAGKKGEAAAVSLIVLGLMILLAAGQFRLMRSEAEY